MLLAAALLLKLVIPAGLMLSSQKQTLTVTICADATAQDNARTVAIPIKRAGGESHDPAKGSCPYAALSMTGLGAADPVLLAAALAFVLASGFAPRPMRPLRKIAHLRPPLRGPPLAA